MEELIRIDHEWIPNKRGASLYMRPTFMSMDNRLGVSPVEDAKLFVISCPVGTYFQSGIKGIDIICNNSDFSRTWRGGFGHAKLGA